MSVAVSILIPVYNGKKYLARALDSALGQTFCNFEIVCVDDGSTDGTGEILRHYAAADSRVRVLTSRQNFGTLHARVTALRAARGEYVLFLDSDDELDRDILQAAHATATGVDIVRFQMNETRFTGKNLIYYPAKVSSDGCVGRILRGLDLLFLTKDSLDIIYLFNKLVRRSVFLEAIGPIPRSLLRRHICYHEDVLLSALLYLRASSCLPIPVVGYCHHWNSDSLISLQTRQNSAFLRHVRDRSIVRHFLLSHVDPALRPIIEKITLYDSALWDEKMRKNLAVVGKMRERLKNL